MEDPEMVTLPDGRVIHDRRRPPKQRFLERVAAEPLASIAIGLTLAVLAWGTITSNTRNATESHNASTNSRAASDNASAARSLAATIKAAQDQLAALGAVSRKATFDSHQAMQDTLVCILRIPPAERGTAAINNCIHRLTPPPVDDTTTTTRTR